MSRNAINSPRGAAIGPYSHAVRCENGLVFLSGQTPIDSKGKMVEGDFAAQTLQCFENLHEVLEACGLSFSDVVKVNVFLTDMENFAAMNAVYRAQFSEPLPARTTIGVASLPRGAIVEMEMIAQMRS